MVDDHHRCVFLHIVRVEQAAFFQLQTAHVEILLAHAVEGRGQVSVTIGQGRAGRGHGRGRGDIALLPDDFRVVDGQGFDAAAPAVAETASGEDADGVGTHRIDVFEDFFLRTVAQSDDGHNRRNADDDAEHGQERTHFVRHNRLHRHFEGLDKLVVIKQPRRFFFDAFYFAFGDFGIF